MTAIDRLTADLGSLAAWENSHGCGVHAEWVRRTQDFAKLEALHQAAKAVCEHRANEPLVLADEAAYAPWRREETRLSNALAAAVKAVDE